LTQTHKFNIGQKVKLFLGNRGTLRGAAPIPEEHEVVRLLPAEDNEFQYRVRAVAGRTDRVVRESQLR